MNHLHLGLIKQYYMLWKAQLTGLLNKKDISVGLFILLAAFILLVTVIIMLLLTILVGYLSSLLFEPIYCMDSSVDGYNELLTKIARIQSNIDYFSEQAKEGDRLFKEALRDNLPEDVKQERLVAKRESETNLNSERKALRILKNRLDNGNFNYSFSTKSSLGKRNFEE